jgi:hypothetical protein
MNNLAVLYDKQGKFDEAEQLHMECLEKRRATLGDTHADTLWSVNKLVALYRSQGKCDQADRMQAEWSERG